jgi:Calcium binding
MARPKTKKESQYLASLIDGATIDCYDEYEQRMGLLISIEERVECPFTAKIIGEKVVVKGFEVSKSGESVFAICERNGREYHVDIDSLEWVKPLPEGFEWIEAYFAWRDGDY